MPSKVKPATSTGEVAARLKATRVALGVNLFRIPNASEYR